MTQEKARRLGRGLDALLAPSAVPAAELRFPARGDDRPGLGFRTVPVSAVVPNRLQPRKTFSPVELAELQASIAVSGLLQPLLVRPLATGFELVAGERRFRAVQALGWKEVPVQVRDIDDQALLSLALIENLQRSDLNPIEEAEGYQELITKFSLTQQQVADSVGRERSSVANMLRLLALPASVLGSVRSGELSLGHAKVLLGLADGQRIHSLAAEVIANGLTVREVERRVRDEGKRPALVRRSHPEAKRPAEARLLEEALRRKFQTDVSITVSTEGKGDVRMSFYSADDLERLLDLLLGANREPL